MVHVAKSFPVHLFYMFDTIAADGLVTLVAKASADSSHAIDPVVLKQNRLSALRSKMSPSSQELYSICEPTTLQENVLLEHFSA